MFQQLWKYSLFSIRRTHFSSILQSSPQTGNTPRFKNSTHYHRVYRYILIYWDIDIRRNLAVNSPSMKSTQSECSLYGQGTKYSRCMGASNESAWQCLPQNMFTVQQGCLSQIKQPLYIYIQYIYKAIQSDPRCVTLSLACHSIISFSAKRQFGPSAFCWFLSLRRKEIWIHEEMIEAYRSIKLLAGSSERVESTLSTSASMMLSKKRCS